MPKAKTPSFILKKPLKTDSYQEKILSVRINAERQLYNACLCECLKRAMRNSLANMVLV